MNRFTESEKNHFSEKKKTLIVWQSFYWIQRSAKCEPWLCELILEMNWGPTKS